MQVSLQRKPELLNISDRLLNFPVIKNHRERIFHDSQREPTAISFCVWCLNTQSLPVCFFGTLRPGGRKPSSVPPILVPPLLLQAPAPASWLLLFVSVSGALPTTFSRPAVKDHAPLSPLLLHQALWLLQGPFLSSPAGTAVHRGPGCMPMGYRSTDMLSLPPLGNPQCLPLTSA